MIGCERFFRYRKLLTAIVINLSKAQNGTFSHLSRCAISHIGCELYSALVIYIIMHYAICVEATLTTYLKYNNKKILY